MQKLESIHCQQCTYHHGAFIPSCCSIFDMNNKRLKNSQLSFYIIIDFIFKAVFFIKAKAIISLYGTAFCYGFKKFNKLALFAILGILG